MAETLALAVGVPAALGAVWLASRRSWMPAFRDVRGIALQTVIVIVVMLVIAGGVAGVLLSRGSDVVADLEAQDVSRNVTSATECQAAGRSILGNDTVNVVAGARVPATANAIYWNANECFIQGAVGVGANTIRRNVCGAYQGADGVPGSYDAGAAALAEYCTLT